MASVLRMNCRFLRSPLPPRQFPTTGFQSLDNSATEEEERELFYSPTTFYLAEIGEVLHARYQIVGKLAFGGYSTVLL